MKKGLALLSLVAIMATTASAHIKMDTNHHKTQQHYLNKAETVSLLKSLPHSERLVNDYKKGIIQVLVSTKNPDYYIVMVKPKNGSIQQFFISKNKKYALLGALIDLKTGQNITDHPPVNANIVKKGIAFTFGKGKKTVYLVTDPQCPFCKMLNNNKKAMNELAKKYTINVILYPLPFHHNSKEMILYILQAKTAKQRQERLNAIFHGSTDYKKLKLTKTEKRKLENKMKAGMNAAVELNFKGTPSVFDKNFNPVSINTLINKN